MSIDPDLNAAIARARLGAAPYEVPVCVVLEGIPPGLYSDFLRSLITGLDFRGWEPFYRATTGLAVLWVRPILAAGQDKDDTRCNDAANGPTEGGTIMGQRDRVDVSEDDVSAARENVEATRAETTRRKATQQTQESETTSSDVGLDEREPGLLQVHEEVQEERPKTKRPGG